MSSDDLCGINVAERHELSRESLQIYIYIYIYIYMEENNCIYPIRYLIRSNNIFEKMTILFETVLTID